MHINAKHCEVGGFFSIGYDSFLNLDYAVGSLIYRLEYNFF